jgi:hypothetical protein
MQKMIMLLFLSFFFHAPSFGQEEYAAFGPRMIALDTTVSYAGSFSAAIASRVPGYAHILTDKETPGKLRHIFKSGNGETLRLEYRYAKKDIEGAEVPIVTYQRILGSAEAITAVYNFLFDSDLTPDKLPMAISSGIEISYRGHQGQFILEPDDFAPGYWAITFL